MGIPRNCNFRLGSRNDRVKGIENGHELEMPGGRGNGKEEIIEAVKTGKVPESKLDSIVDRIISIAKQGEHIQECIKYDAEEHHKIAQTIAEESIVLLKMKRIYYQLEIKNSINRGYGKIPKISRGWKFNN